MDIGSIKAVVSGGASGLGYSVAEEVVRRKGRVALLDVDDFRGQEAAANLGNGAIFICTDVTSAQEVDAAVAQVADRFHGITLAVSCAGILGPARLLGHDGPMDPALFHRVIDVNLMGSFHLTRAAASAMQHNEPRDDGERGVIINVASIAAYEGQIGQVAYAASKAGIAGMTLPLARELGQLGIRAVAIAPGIFRTPMVEALPEEVQLSLSSALPFPSRLGEPAEFAALVIHIYSNPMFNGEVVRLDGALRMGPH